MLLQLQDLEWLVFKSRITVKPCHVTALLPVIQPLCYYGLAIKKSLIYFKTDSVLVTSLTSNQLPSVTALTRPCLHSPVSGQSPVSNHAHLSLEFTT